MSETLSNKRIVKNTFYLYIRMGATLLVQFYTSRVVLQVLGVDDFGLWSVIASLIVSFSFVQGPLTVATQRFLNYEMGSGGNRLNHIFSTSLIMFLIIGFVLFVALESAGVWFLNTHMNIASEKLTAANWVFQFSILSFIVTFVRMPYESAIIAYERMSFYAVVCIVEAVLLLGIVYVLLVPAKMDKLVMYGVLMFVSKLTVTLCCKFYCNQKIACTHFRFVRDGTLMHQIASFSGWNLFGALSSVTATQGINVLMNLFFGVSVNAAYGIASQVGAGVYAFVYNFQKATNPQIIKSYASGEKEHLYKLIYMSSKYSFLLLFALVCPIMYNMDFVLQLWLNENVPHYTSWFCQLTLIYMLVVSFSIPMDTALFATGEIKRYQITISLLLLLNILISYFLFKVIHTPPISALAVKIIVEVIILIIRMLFVKKYVELSLYTYIRKVFRPSLFTICITLLGMYVVLSYVTWDGEWEKLLGIYGMFFLLYGISLWTLGLDRSERMIVKKWLLRFQ